MSKHTSRKPFFAQLLDDQGAGADIETKKYPSDSEDLAWTETPVSGRETRKSPALSDQGRTP